MTNKDKHPMTDKLNAEKLVEHERFFEPVDLRDNLFGCGDERPVLGTEAVLINDFGGPAANVAWAIMVMQESKNPGSMTKSFAEMTADITPVLVNDGIKVTVHSDDHTEHGPKLDTDLDQAGDIGCGYLKLRQQISGVIAEQAEEIVKILTREKPEKYNNPAEIKKLEEYIHANAVLAQRSQIYTTGRDVAKQAVAAGAETIVVTGDHVAKVGYLNSVPKTSFDTKTAMDNGVPAYNHNTWASLECYEIVRNNGSELKGLDFSLEDFETANDVDAVGTMLALGVEEVRCRK